MLMNFFSELVALFSKYEFPWDKKFGFPLNEVPAVIARSNCVATK
jgi:hypothetical protein